MAVARQDDFLAVADQIRRVVGVCVHLVVVAVEDVEAVLFWNTRCATPADPPFAKAAGGVAGLLEQLRDGDIVSADGSAAAITAH